ncbi:carbon-phosphorus lyase [Pelistega indica]|uniref:Carbon-phosphorus lyase n=1 Tax=Pelistega indica TaxID=1414851 RepID=V8G7I6_9BURK|nr:MULTISPECIES: phosphonate C-P lyase system protein PhnH [Pelistega]ETD72479.1 carbon-phosphorus lyase [Pelistega indica]
MIEAVLQKGFNDEVQDAQLTFRAALKALSEPGTYCQAASVAPLASLSGVGVALILTLCDSDSRVYLGKPFDNEQIKHNLSFHCGCQIVTDIDQADFVLITEQEINLLSSCRLGTDRDPEKGATVLLQVTSLQGGDSYCLTGPGIETEKIINPQVSAQLWELRQQLNQFPRGLDFFMFDAKAMLGIPRTTKVSMKKVGE